MKGVLRYCALALCAALAMFEPVVERVRTFSYKVLTVCEDVRGKLVKFTAEIAAAFRTRSSEAVRANGMTSESHGFRLTGMVKFLPFEVGWQGAKII